MTMKWHKIYFEGKNSEQMKKFSENQVQEFTKLLKKIEKMKVVILAGGMGTESLNIQNH